AVKNGSITAFGFLDRSTYESLLGDQVPADLQGFHEAASGCERSNLIVLARGSGPGFSPLAGSALVSPTGLRLGVLRRWQWVLLGGPELHFDAGFRHAVATSSSHQPVDGGRVL